MLNESMQGDLGQEVTYKGEYDLINECLPNTSVVFNPTGWKATDERQWIVFHGGRWSRGDKGQFLPHCRYFAKLGYVCISMNYGLVNRTATVKESLMDCKSGIRYFRKHSYKFGINPKSLIVFGESAGGHLAASLGSIERFSHPDDDLSISCVPNLIVNCNGIVDLTGKWKECIGDKAILLEKERTKLAMELSQYYAINYNQPDTIMFHGEIDMTVPICESENFLKKYIDFGNKAVLFPIKNTKHSFILFNYTANEKDVLEAIEQIGVCLKKYSFE